MPAIIKVAGLTKHFGSIRAVEDLSFSVEKGEIYGFLGQNGAGKSTTIRMLLTLVRPTGGEMEILGMNLKTNRREILRRVGAVIERPDTYNYLSGLENLSLFARWSGLRIPKKTLYEKLAKVGLEGREHGKVRTYSQGMKQRLAIAIAMVHDPEIIVLDEPTNGLDPQGIADIRNLILDLGRHHQKTILISSHLLSEVELIADRILIIDKGKKIMEGKVSDLLNPDRMILEITTGNEEKSFSIIMGSLWKAHFRKRKANQFIFQIQQSEIPKITRDLADQGVEIMQIQPRHSLEDYFLSLTTPNQHVDNFAN